MKQKNWHGTDRSNEVSLFEYGFLMRWVAKQKEFQVIYQTGEHTSEYERFSYDWFNPEEWLRDLRKEKGTGNFPDIDEINSGTGLQAEWEELYTSNPCQLLADLLWMYGTENIFGSDYSGGYKLGKIKQLLNKAL